MMGNLPWHCTSTSQDCSSQLDLEWIAPVVAKFRHLQDSRSHYHAHRHTHYAAMGKWPLHCISTGQDGSNELYWKWIGQVIAEFGYPQDSRSPYHAHEKCGEPSGCSVPLSARFQKQQKIIYITYRVYVQLARTWKHNHGYHELGHWKTLKTWG